MHRPYLALGCNFSKIIWKIVIDGEELNFVYFENILIYYVAKFFKFWTTYVFLELMGECPAPALSNCPFTGILCNADKNI